MQQLTSIVNSMPAYGKTGGRDEKCWELASQLAQSKSAVANESP